MRAKRGRAWRLDSFSFVFYFLIIVFILAVPGLPAVSPSCKEQGLVPSFGGQALSLQLLLLCSTALGASRFSTHGSWALSTGTQ